MKNFLFIYITCEDVAQAEDIGRALLKKRLVACINIINGVHSAYFWPPKKGRVEEANEAILLCKTINAKWKALEREVLKLHSYTAPDIMAIPITHVTKKYADWLVGELT